jgi:hypothetical protein
MGASKQLFKAALIQRKLPEMHVHLPYLFQAKSGPPQAIQRNAGLSGLAAIIRFAMDYV